MNVTANPFPPDTSGAANLAKRRIVKIGAFTIHNRSSFQVKLATPEGIQIIACADAQFILDAAAQAGIALPSTCLQGQCLTCAGRLQQGEVDQSAAASYFPEDRAAGFVLLCTARPRTDLVVTTHQQWEMRRHRIAHNLPAPYT